MAVFQWAGGFRDHWTDAAISRHRAIIAAMLDGDVEQATEELRQHIEEVKVWAIDELGAAQINTDSAPARSPRILAAAAT
jgi:DNA-binding GntR family transcriptional regulator